MYLPPEIVDIILQYAKNVQPPHFECMKQVISKFNQDYERVLSSDDAYGWPESYQYHREYCWFEFYNYFGLRCGEFKQI